jgi:hypothetical protein
MSKQYKVWYRTDKDFYVRDGGKVKIVTALNGKDAKKIVQIMFPGCKVTTVRLVSKFY